MRKRNLPLILGGIVIGIIVLVMIFPEKFTSYNPYVIEGIKTKVQRNAPLSIEGAPFAPSSENILGTDQLGRDILSLIIYGTRLTIGLGLFVVVGRFLVALPLGIAAGFGNGLCKSIINIFNLIFSAIPALLISLLILNISFFTGLAKSESILAFVIVLTTVGFGKLAELIRERVEGILSKPFITGEKAIGKSNVQIAIRNVLPHLAPELIVLIFIEVALALSMIMELGFFGVYVGNLRILADGNLPLNISFEPEWASMLSTSLTYVNKAPWMVISSAVTFFISILGFNLFGEGLREKLQKKGFKVKINVTSKKIFKPIAIALVAAIALGLFNQGIKIYNNKNSENKLESILNWEFKDQVLVGSEEADYTANKLKESLQNIGFNALGEDFIQQYKISNMAAVNNYTFTTKNSSEEKKFILGEDFSIITSKNISLTGELYDARELDIFNIMDYSAFDDKFILLDEEVYSREVIKDFNNIIKNKSKALGVIDIVKKEDKLPVAINSEILNDSLIYVSRNSSEKLIEQTEISIDIELKELFGQGNNVVGILPGTNPSLSKEVIMISMGYNYFADDKESGIEKIKMMLETAQKLYDNKKNQGRSIIIAFWDGNMKEEGSGVKNYVDNPLKTLNNIVINIDLTNMDIKGDTIVLDPKQVPVAKYSSWAFNHEFKLNMINNGIKVQEYINKKNMTEILNNLSSAEVMYYKGAVPTISILPKYEIDNSEKDVVREKFVDILVSSLSKINY